MQIAKIFLNVDNKMTGLRFAGGPSFFPGFGNGTNIPSIISSGPSPVFAISLNISYIYGVHCQTLDLLCIVLTCLVTCSI